MPRARRGGTGSRGLRTGSQGATRAAWFRFRLRALEAASWQVGVLWWRRNKCNTFHWLWRRCSMGPKLAREEWERNSSKAQFVDHCRTFDAVRGRSRKSEGVRRRPKPLEVARSLPKPLGAVRSRSKALGVTRTLWANLGRL